MSFGSPRPGGTRRSSDGARASPPAYHHRGASQFQSLSDWEAAAAPILRLSSPGGAGALGYYAGGAADEETLRRNLSQWKRLLLVPRVLVDVSRVSLSTTLLGRACAAPFGVAPTAYHRLAHADAEVATARGAVAAGAPLRMSSAYEAARKSGGGASAK